MVRLPPNALPLRFFLKGFSCQRRSLLVEPPQMENKEILGRVIEEAYALRAALEEYLEFLAKTPVEKLTPADVREARDTLDEIRATKRFLEGSKGRRTPPAAIA
jgi:hypothetical protein